MKTERELPLRGSFRQRAGEPLCLTVSAEVRHIGTVSAEVMGAVAERARTAGSSPEAVRERLLKTGGTGFRFSELAVSMEEGYFFPGQATERIEAAGVGSNIRNNRFTLCT